MENKNFYKSCNPEFRNRLFFESRLLMKNDPVPEEKEPAAEEKPKKSPKKKPKEVKQEEAKKITEEARQEEAELKVGAEGKRRREQLKKEEKLPKRGPEKRIQLPTRPKLDMQVYLEKNFRDEKTGPGIEKWSLSINAEKTQINWQSWDHSTLEGVQKIYDDCQDLNLINQDVNYYDTTFAILRNSTRGINKNLSTDDLRNAFLKPADPGNREKIAALPPDGDFPGGEAFLKAFDHLTFIKAQIYALNEFQKKTLAKQREAGEDPVAGKITDFVRSNVATFQKAIRERDYATAGVYALGAYAIWQTLGKKIFGDDHKAGEAADKHFDYKKWLLIGAAVYCGNKFAKNAGYDILKMTGFKTGDAEVAGTPMEVLSNILQKSEFSEQTKDLDYGIVLTMSETSLTTLEDLRKQSNKNGIDFIHPREFPALFPDLKNAWPFKLGLGEEGLKDYIGMSNTKLGPKEKEYIRVGQQIYKLSLAMQATYDGTLHQHNKNFRDKTYQDALKRDPFKDSKVRHLMAAVHEYANERVPGGLFSGKKKQEIEALLNDNLEKGGLKGESFALETEIQEGTRHYWAKLHGFPVVVVASSTGYRVYMRGNYGKAYNSAPGPGIAEIPLQGPGAKSAVETIIKTIEAKMRELVEKSPILGDKKTILSSLKYVNGQWQCEVDDPAIDDLDIAGGKSIVPINPDEDGLSIIGQSLDRKSRFPTEILPRLVNQSNFHSLNIFLSAGHLDAKYDPSGAPNVFTLIIGKQKKIETKIVYNKATKTFNFLGGSAKEAELFKSGSGFAEELSEALGEDVRIKKQLDEWQKLINNTNESYVYHFFKSLPNWYTGASWSNLIGGIDVKQFTGSVAKNYTIGLLESQKALILTRMAGASTGATSLSDISKNYDQIFVPAVNKMDSLRSKFSEMNTQNDQNKKDWDEDTFNTTIFGEIAKIGISSNDYQGWYAKFVNEIFYKYGMDDLRKGNAMKARDVVKVFSYYTAAIDNKEIDGADLGLTVSREGVEYIKRIKQAKESLKTAGKPTGEADVAREANAQLIGAGFPALATLLPGDVIIFSDLSTKLEKQKQHKQAADYAEYVSGKIYEKFNNGDLGKQVNIPIPENRGFWGIEQFESWKTNHPAAAHEFIDTRETLKTTRNYVTLDQYLSWDPTDPKRATTRKADIILPRKDFQHRFQRDASGTVLDIQGFQMAMDIIGPYDTTTKQIEKINPTTAEEAYKRKFNEVLEKFKNKYAAHIVSEKLNDFRETFTLSAKADFDMASSPRETILDFKVDQLEYTDTDGSIKTAVKDIVKEGEALEKEFDVNYKTITLSVQERYINQRIKEIFDRNILSDHGKNIYLSDPSGAWDFIIGMGRDIKYWLFD